MVWILSSDFCALYSPSPLAHEASASDEAFHVHFMYHQLPIPHLPIICCLFGVLKFPVASTSSFYHSFFPENDHKNLLSFLEVLVSAPRVLPFFLPFWTQHFYPEYSYAMNISYLWNSNSFLWKMIEDKCSPREAASWSCQTQWPAVNWT